MALHVNHSKPEALRAVSTVSCAPVCAARNQQPPRLGRSRALTALGLAERLVVVQQESETLNVPSWSR